MLGLIGFYVAFVVVFGALDAYWSHSIKGKTFVSTNWTEPEYIGPDTTTVATPSVNPSSITK